MKKYVTVGRYVDYYILPVQPGGLSGGVRVNGRTNVLCG